MKRPALALLFALGLTAAPTLGAESWKLVVRLEGKVQSSVDKQASWQPIFAQRILREQDSARTLADSKARIELSDGTITTLAPSTTCVLSEFDAKRPKVRIKVESGGVRARVTKAFSNGRYELDTRHGVLAAQGTDFAVWYRESSAPSMLASLVPLADRISERQDENYVMVAVWEGTVTVDRGLTGPGGVTVLHAGDTAAMGSEAVKVNPSGVTPDSAPPSLKSATGSSGTGSQSVETSTYVQDSAQGEGASGSHSSATDSPPMTGQVIPTSAGRLNTTTTTTTQASTTKYGNVQVDVMFRGAHR